MSGRWQSSASSLPIRGAFPAARLRVKSAAGAEALRRLADGECDLHCGGIHTGDPLPPFLRGERFLDLIAGIVVRRDHPLFGGTVAPEDLACTLRSTSTGR